MLVTLTPLNKQVINPEIYYRQEDKGKTNQDPSSPQIQRDFQQTGQRRESEGVGTAHLLRLGCLQVGRETLISLPSSVRYSENDFTTYKFSPL